MKREKTPQELQWFVRIIAVVIIGIVLRLVISFVVLGDMPQYEDGTSYSLQAQQFLDGSIDYLYFPPGTALATVPFYWLLGQSTVVDHFVGVAFTSGFMISAVWFVGVAYGWSRVTFFASILMAFYPHSILSATQISSMPLNAMLLTGATGLAIRCNSHWSWTRWIGGSLCLAAATLTRPTSMMLVVVFGVAALYLLKRHRITPGRVALAGVSMCVVMAVAVYPFMAHNA
ncbi:MAG: hypothetical protein NTX15_02525, partial [Candidatus Kapabacteria bacterium]|nr:hypothetical protein [Candidatus Kapabacteria bacterium]